jgi:hypothetical protein
MAAILERSLVAKKMLKQQIEAAARLASVYAAVEALPAAMPSEVATAAQLAGAAAATAAVFCLYLLGPLHLSGPRSTFRNLRVIFTQFFKYDSPKMYSFFFKSIFIGIPANINHEKKPTLILRKFSSPIC